MIRRTAYDTHLEQLVANAEAAVAKAVETGVVDPQRIGVTGHSHGALMAANLLAHTDLFRAGVASAGGYNKTLTPFGFQNERRSFWKAPQAYDQSSAFFHADKINEPILIVHGSDDANPGTEPTQSPRLFQAVRGHGGTARLVMLPHEPHWFAARESNEHSWPKCWTGRPLCEERSATRICRQHRLNRRPRCGCASRASLA